MHRAPFCGQLHKCLEDVALQSHHIFQWNLCPVCQNQAPLQFSELFQSAGGGQVSPAVLLFVPLEPSDGELWPLVHVLQQHGLPPVQLCLGVLIQLYLLLRQPGGLRDGSPVAAQGGKGAENRGPVADGHPWVSLRGGMREAYDVVVWPAHA